MSRDRDQYIGRAIALAVPIDETPRVLRDGGARIYTGRDRAALLNLYVDEWLHTLGPAELIALAPVAIYGDGHSIALARTPLKGGAYVRALGLGYYHERCTGSDCPSLWMHEFHHTDAVVSGPHAALTDSGAHVCPDIPGAFICGG